VPIASLNIGYKVVTSTEDICNGLNVLRLLAIMRWKPGVYLTRAWFGTGSWQTPGRTERQFVLDNSKLHNNITITW